MTIGIGKGDREEGNERRRQGHFFVGSWDRSSIVSQFWPDYSEQAQNVKARFLRSPKVPSDDLRGATVPETTSMNNRSKGLPLTRSHVEQIFPKLTPAQIRRIATHGHMRAMQRGEVLYEQGDSAVPFFVMVSGELEIVCPFGAVETLVTVYRSRQFTGEVGTLSGRRTLPRACY